MTRSTRNSPLAALPLFGIGAGALWLLYRTFQVRGGKEWRGYAGTVILKPSVVYRVEMIAPLSNTPSSDLTIASNQITLEQKLASGGAKNFLWNVLSEGVHLYFDQSFQAPSTLTFGKGGVGPLLPLTARRLDGLDWDSP